MLSHSTILNIKALLGDKALYGYNDQDYSRSGDTTSGSAVITINDTDNLTVADGVEGDGIVVGSVIVSIDSSTQITIDNNATVTDTSVTLTVTHSATTDFNTSIESFYTEVELVEMFDIITETVYDVIDATATADLTNNYNLVILAERYIIAAYFLESKSRIEISERMSMREFKIVDGIGTSVSGQTGKSNVGEGYYNKAIDYLTKAEYDTSHHAGLYSNYIMAG